MSSAHWQVRRAGRVVCAFTRGRAVRSSSEPAARAGSRVPPVKKHVLIPGAGFAGPEVATRLSETLQDAVRVTLLDGNDSFVFGYSKLAVMLGRQSPDDVRMYYSDIAKDAVE